MPPYGCLLQRKADHLDGFPETIFCSFHSSASLQPRYEIQCLHVHLYAHRVCCSYPSGFSVTSCLLGAYIFNTLRDGLLSKPNI